MLIIQQIAFSWRVIRIDKQGFYKSFYLNSWTIRKYLPTYPNSIKQARIKRVERVLAQDTSYQCPSNKYYSRCYNTKYLPTPVKPESCVTKIIQASSCNKCLLHCFVNCIALWITLHCELHTICCFGQVLPSTWKRPWLLERGHKIIVFTHRFTYMRLPRIAPLFLEIAR